MKGANNMSIKITLEYKGTSILDFEDRLGMDEQFDLTDSIIWLLDYGTKKDNTTTHNGIGITISEETYDLPYKESE